MSGHVSVTSSDPRTIPVTERVQPGHKSQRNHQAVPTDSSKEVERAPSSRTAKVREPDPVTDFARLREQLKEVAAAMPAGANLLIDRDADTGRFVYRFIDPESGEVLRQFPADEALNRAASARVLSGRVVDDNA